VLRIAHDLRNLLTLVVGYCDLAEQKFAPSYIAKIRGAAVRCVELLLENLAGPAEAAEFDLNTIAAELALLMRDGMEGHGIRLQLDLEIGQPFRIAGSALSMFRALLNLCFNASESMAGHGGKLIIETRAGQENQALIIVRDTGEGMSTRFMSKMWEAPNGKKGEGLAIVEEAVACLGGRIDVESSEGVGTQFTISLPRSAGLSGGVMCVG
jgi:signal transduction histidine kinase